MKLTDVLLLEPPFETTAAPVAVAGKAPNIPRYAGLAYADLDYLTWDRPDMSQDYLTWENMESVTYQSTRTGQGGGTQESRLDFVRIRALSEREQSASGGVYTAQDVNLLIPRAVLPAGIVPKPADVWIDDEGTPHTILEVGRGKRDASNQYQTYRCVSRNLVLAYDLRDTIDIERAATTWDAAGMKRKSWPSEGGGGFVLYPKLAARVQNTSDELIEELGIKGFSGTFIVICSKQVPLVTFEDRIKVLVSNELGQQQASLVPMYLDIIGIRNPALISELPALDCVLPA